MAKTGSLTINSENIFPIIKKWMYSDHDIFARELVSNGCDAITKLKKLDMIGQYSIPEGKDMEIRIEVDTENKKVSFSDTGLGMDADEVEGAGHFEFFVENGPFGADGFEVIVAGKVEEEIPFGGIVNHVFALVESFDTTVEGCAQLARFISFLPPFFDKDFGRDAHFGGFFGGYFFHFEV